MKIEATTAIVISGTNYSESSKVLNLFSKEYGIIGVMSKGCRKLKSKLRAVSNPLVYGTFQIYYKEKGMSTLIECDVKDAFLNTMLDLKKISYSSFLLEFVSNVYKQNEDGELFDLLISALKKIDEGYDPHIITVIVQFQALKYLGVSLSLDACAICGTDKAIVTVSADTGGYICAACHSDEKLYSEKMYKIIRLFNYVDIAKISKLDVANSTLKEIDEFIDDYYERYTGIYMGTKNVLKKNVSWD